MKNISNLAMKSSESLSNVTHFKNAHEREKKQINQCAEYS